MNRFFVLFALLFGAANAFSQNDSKGTSDAVFFDRVENYYIEFDEKKDFDVYGFWNGKETVFIQGKFHQIHYSIKKGEKSLSSQKIIKKYSEDLDKMKGEKLFEGFLPDVLFQKNKGLYAATYKIPRRNNNELWLQIVTIDNGLDYELISVDGKPRPEELSAKDMLTKINDNGQVDVYVNFDINKSEIRPESYGVINQVVVMLNSQPAMHLRIEGHTDNTGEQSQNLKLSETRAQAVLNALVDKGIDKERLSVIGFGQDKPIADNSTEEGRAKNRRVVLVKTNQ